MSSFDSLLLSADARWAWLLVPIALGLFWRVRSGYITKVSVRVRQNSAGSFLRAFFPVGSAVCGLVLLVAALADITRGYAVVEEYLALNRIFVAIDNSSSMYDFKSNLTTEIHCADKNLREIYPRIFGACRALHRLVDETEKHANRKRDSEMDRIAFIRFALYSFGQVPPTSDYAHLRRSIEGMNWRVREALGIQTEIHLALWDMYRLALERNRRKESGLAPVSFDDMMALARALAPEMPKVSYNPGDPGTTSVSPSPPQRPDASFSLPHRWRDTTGSDGTPVPGLATRIKEEFRDTVFIFITDAAMGQLEKAINASPVSLRKMLDLASIIELPVYFVSTDEPNAVYKRMARKTGFTLDGKDYHGDFLVANRDEGYANLEALIADILEVRFGRTVKVQTERRVSYAGPLALASLTFFVLGVFFRQTVSRSLTDI